MRSRFTIRVITVGLTAAITVSLAGTAGHSAGSEADQITTAITRATAGMGEVTPSGGAVIPATSADPIRISGPQGDLAIGLPGSPAAAVHTFTGTTIYPSAGSADVAVQTLADGTVRALVAIADASAPTEYRFPMTLPAGARLESTPDGGVTILNDEATIGAVATPWAKDAHGAMVPTRYHLDGTTLVQAVDFNSHTAFPVIADPKITYGFGVYLNLWGREARAIGIEYAAILGTGVVVSCTLTSKLPHPILRSIAVMACGAISLNLLKLFQVIHRIWSTGNIEDSACYQTKLNDVSPLKKVDLSNCR